MSLLTNWGYKIEDACILDDLLPSGEFHKATSNKFAGDPRIADSLASTSQILRDYCGWHIAPEMVCTIEEMAYSPRITAVKDGLLIQLPARYVSKVNSVELNGNEINDYWLEANGILRIFNFCGISRRSKLKIEYVAGVPAALVGAVKSVAINRTVKQLSTSNGVQSETAGGVSISYNSAWMNGADGLSENEKAVLMPYLLKGVF